MAKDRLSVLFPSSPTPPPSITMYKNLVGIRQMCRHWATRFGLDVSNVTVSSSTWDTWVYLSFLSLLEMAKPTCWKHWKIKPSGQELKGLDLGKEPGLFAGVSLCCQIFLLHLPTYCTWFPSFLLIYLTFLSQHVSFHFPDKASDEFDGQGRSSSRNPKYGRTR